MNFNSTVAITDDYSSRKLLSKELLARGWMCNITETESKAYKFFVSPTGKVWMPGSARLQYPFVSANATHVSKEKDLAYVFAQHLGVRIPATMVLPSNKAAIQTFLKSHAPIVVKPTDGYGSRGLSLDIMTSGQLKNAIDRASQISTKVLLQEQVLGDEVRFTVLNGEIVSTLLRQSPRLKGDGVSTLAQLLKDENRARGELALAYIQYPQLMESIVSLGALDMEQVLAQDEILSLSKSTMISGGASVYDVTDEIHDSYKEVALKLARNVNPAFIVVDMMIQDYLRPLTSGNYAFIEFNTAPSLKMYYSARDGRQYDIVKKIADLLDAKGTD